MVTVPMALVDFIPVALYFAAGVLLMRGLYGKMSKGAFALYAAGILMISIAGLCKALWKLLYGAGVCDFVSLYTLQFPMQSMGFTLGALGLLAMLFHRQGAGRVYTAVPVVFSGTMLFVSLTVLGCLGMSAVYLTLSVRLRRPLAAALFVLSFLLAVAMGYLSSQDFSDPLMHWLAQGVNIAGQGCLLWGAVILRKAGLEQLSLPEARRAH